MNTISTIVDDTLGKKIRLVVHVEGHRDLWIDFHRGEQLDGLITLLQNGRAVLNQVHRASRWQRFRKFVGL